MHYKSPFPPLPPLPEVNVHDFLFSSPALNTPEDKLLLVEPLSGKRWYRDEFKERVYDAATAIASPSSPEGLGFEPARDMVAIFSYNCMVRLVV